MIKIITSFKQDTKLEKEWNRLFDICSYATPFQTFNFISTAWKYIASNKESLYIIVVLDDRTKEYKAIFPSSIDKHGVIRFICQDYIDFCSAIVNPIYDNYNLYEEVGTYINKETIIREVRLLNLKHDNPLLSTLKPFVCNFHIRACSYYSVLPISVKKDDNDFIDSFYSLNGKKKKNLRRYYENFNTNCVLKILNKSNGDNYPNDIVQEITSSMINKGIRTKQYFSSEMLELWEELYDKGVVEIAILIQNNNVKSVNFIYNDKKCSELIKWIMVYEDNSWNKAINLLIAEQLYQQGGYTINFARGIYDYKLVNFHPDVMTLFNVTITKSYKGAIINYIKETKEFVRDILDIKRNM